MKYAYISATLLQLAKCSPVSKAIFYKTSKDDYAEHDQFIGVNVPSLRIVAKEFHDISLEDIQLLLYSKINEERLLALIILTNQYASGTSQNAIYQFYMDHLGQVNNWNLVDASAHLIIGRHLFTNQLHEKDKSILLTLAKSDVMWERRIAIVSTWYFIKMHEYDPTLKLAELLLNDDHDLIHKSVGWMLREVGKKNSTILKEFLNQFSQNMPRTMLRYAIERFSEIERQSFLNRDYNSKARNNNKEIAIRFKRL